MARVTVEDCIENIDNRFMLVMMAAKRVKQLYKGAPATLPVRNNRFVVTALREIAAGHVAIDEQGKRQA